ncbi:hypothetical protein GGI07_000964 [Coemansia sp. Benny D115]|nr:hypothetical protein GGI07_000964 [Coemansia sp. Benny D115]
MAHTLGASPGRWTLGLPETRAVMLVAACSVLAVPLLTTLNNYTANYPLDRLHYALFQLLLSADTEHIRQPELSGSHRFAEKCAELEKTFLQLASKDEESSADSPWTALASVSNPYPITVQGHRAKPFCFRITFFAPTTPATAFDLLANILRRPEWDELTDSTEIIERLGQGDAIHYVKAKAIWPTAARDSVLLSHITSVDLDDALGDAKGGGQRGYLNVSQSTVDSRVPERDAEGLVRMEAGIAGQLITPAAEADRQRLGLQGDSWCRVVQIADGDLKGWIPKSVIKFIATQALPRSLTKVCKQLSSMPPSSDSQLVRDLNQQPQQPQLMVAAKKEVFVAAPAVQKSQATAVVRQMGRAGGALAGPGRQGGRAQWLAWLRVIVHYAAPSIIAAVTSLIINLIIQRRWKR